MLWALGDPGLLEQQSREVIASQDHTVMVSIASLWECAIKSSFGKLELPEDFFTALPEAGYEIGAFARWGVTGHRVFPLPH